ncbi:MAG: acyl-CoA dehydrogenase family protein, partial [Pseudomonadota bacterium]
MFARTIFGEEHNMFREQVRRFVEAEIVPYHDQWEKDGRVSREAWRKAGENGLLCVALPESYGGAGADFLFSMIVLEELGRVGATGPGFSLHSDVVAPYVLHYGSEAIKRHWLPRMARGEAIGSLGMTEPGAGSDVQGIKTTA